VSQVWTLAIRCDKCAETFGARTLRTHVGYGVVLTQIRAEAQRAGWTRRKGGRAGSTIFDHCPAHRPEVRA
jgi:hypothetical protein